MRRIETYEWWAELVRLKDQLSLRELAERFDVTPGAISAAFKRSGVSRKPAPPGPRARRRGKDDALPPEPGEVQGEARPGSKDARILPFREMLGAVPDSLVAKKAGVSIRTIASFRARNRITGYTGPRRRGADRAPRKSRIDAFAELVGTVPDRVVAEKANVSINAVRNWRLKHQVAGARRPAEPESLAHSQPGRPRTNGSGSGAWKVIVGSGHDRVVRVVVASSLSDAASRVESARLGPIVALEWIGEIV